MSPASRWKSACVAVLLSALGVRGQDDSVIRVTVNQVRIDATVTDRDGNTVRDLESKDFQVYQDGKLQTPIHVEYVTGAKGTPPAGGRELRSNEVQRAIVILVDDASMSFENFVHTREALKKYLEHAMAPGDVVAILRTSQSSSFLDQFTSDPARLRASIDRMRWSAPLGVVEFRPLIRFLRSTTQAMQRIPGKKSLILFAEGLSMTDLMTDSFRRIADSAVRSAVRIYGIDPRGLQTLVLPSSPQQDRSTQRLNDQLGAAAGSVPTATGSNGGGVSSSDDNSGMAFLTAETGGLLLENRNDIGKGFNRFLEDQSGYYMIAWDPGEKAFKPAKGVFADYHKIKVTVSRSGLTARSPRGFYGYDAGSRQAGVAPKVAMQEALLSPFQSGQVNVRMTSRFALENGHGYIESLVRVDGADIVFTPHPEPNDADCHVASLEFLTLPQPVDPRTDTLLESQITSLEMCGAGYRAMMRDGLAVTMMHPVTKAGAYQMRLAVRNAEPDVTAATHSLPHALGKLRQRDEKDVPVGSAHELVEVPNWKTAPTIAGLMLQGAEPAVPQHAGEASEEHMTLAYRAALGGDPAIRIFRPGDTLECDAQILNLADPKSEVKVERAGVDGGPPSYSSGVKAVSGGRVKETYVLQPSMLPGPYLVQVEVTGKDQKGREFRAVREIDFEVQR